MKSLAGPFWGLLLSSALAAECTPGHAADAIKIATLRVAAGAPLYIAQERGYFAKQNLSAELVFMDQPQVMGQGILSGDLDIGMVGLGAAFFNVAGQGALRIIGANNDEAPGFSGLAVAASNQAYASGLHSVRDLGGHSVALTAIGTPPHYALSLLASKYGVAEPTLKILQVGSLPNTVTAVVGGSADATVSAGTILKGPIANNQARLLAYVGDETRFLLTGVVTSGKTADTRGDVVNRFLAAYRAGAKDYHDAFTGPDERPNAGPAAVETLRILANYTGQPIELLKLGVPHIDGDARVDVKNIADQIAWYKSHRMVKPEVDAAKIIDTRYVIALGQ
jgi:NitT/TauT family transport system substrate-binding protein